jgi:glutathione S-transferase
MSFEKFLKPILGMETDEGAVEAKRKELVRHFDVLEGILGAQEFMVGNEWGLVDIFYLPLVDRLMKCGEGDLIKERRNVSSWWERCVGRPAVKKFLDGLLSLEDAKKKLSAKRS